MPDEPTTDTYIPYPTEIRTGYDQPFGEWYSPRTDTVAGAKTDIVPARATETTDPRMTGLALATGYIAGLKGARDIIAGVMIDMSEIGRKTRYQYLAAIDDEIELQLALIERDYGDNKNV